MAHDLAPSASSLSAKGAARVLVRLKTFAALDRQTEALITGLADLQSYRTGAVLASEQDECERPQFVVSGWAARVQNRSNRPKQVLHLVLPGEAIGLRRSLQDPGRRIVALSPVHTLGAEPVQRALLSKDTRWTALRAAWQVAESLEEARILAQIVRLGRYSAYQRVSDMLLELYERLAAVKLADETSFPMPITQEVFADAAGMSGIHMSRTLKQLRQEGLVEIRGGRVYLMNRKALSLVVT